MNRCKWLPFSILVAVLALWAPSKCFAQRFIQNLPTEGIRVVFRGTYRVTKPNPESRDDTIVTDWQQQITLSSVGSQTVEDQGPCRWIELKVERIKADDASLGKAGVLIYKCLIPEAAIGKQTSDFLPIIRGWRKVADNEPKPMQGKLLRISPTITLLDHYPDQKEQDPQSIEIQDLGNVECTVLAGTRKLQGQAGRSECSGELWLSEKVPFGVVKWKATQRREELLGSQEGARYRFAGEVTTEMTVVSGGNDAQTELPEHN